MNWMVSPMTHNMSKSRPCNSFFRFTAENSYRTQLYLKISVSSTAPSGHEYEEIHWLVWALLPTYKQYGAAHFDSPQKTEVFKLLG